MEPEKKRKFKSLNMNPVDLEVLDYLVKKWGCSESAAMRRAMTEAYAILLYQETKKINPA